MQTARKAINADVLGKLKGDYPIKAIIITEVIEDKLNAACSVLTKTQDAREEPLCACPECSNRTCVNQQSIQISLDNDLSSLTFFLDTWYVQDLMMAVNSFRVITP